MNQKHRKEIGKIVREVLKEQGLVTEPSQKPLASGGDKSKTGPAVINVFHAGVRRLEEALKQVQLIEETARRSSVYTVESARSWVCGADVKEGAGIKCVLDTVKPQGLEKALQKSDILVLPTFCLKTAAKVANLICDDQESSIVFMALLQGKKVLATNDGFLVCDILVNEQLRVEIDHVLNKLESFGMVFCSTDELHATFSKMLTGDRNLKASGLIKGADVRENRTPDEVKLITAKVIYAAVDNNQHSVVLAPGGKITPLARDLAKEYSINIIET